MKYTFEKDEHNKKMLQFAFDTIFSNYMKANRNNQPLSNSTNYKEVSADIYKNIKYIKTVKAGLHYVNVKYFHNKKNKNIKLIF